MQGSLTPALKGMEDKIFQVKDYQEDIFNVQGRMAKQSQFKNILSILTVMNQLNLIHLSQSILI